MDDTVPPAAEVRHADDQFVLAAKTAINRACESSYETADAFLELGQRRLTHLRGWGGRKEKAPRWRPAAAGLFRWHMAARAGRLVRGTA